MPVKIDEASNHLVISLAWFTGIDSWASMMPPICRQTSGDGGELANLWAWEDLAGAR